MSHGPVSVREWKRLPRGVQTQKHERGILPADDKWIFDVQWVAKSVGTVKFRRVLPQNHCKIDNPWSKVHGLKAVFVCWYIYIFKYNIGTYLYNFRTRPNISKFDWIMIIFFHSKTRQKKFSLREYPTWFFVLFSLLLLFQDLFELFDRKFLSLESFVFVVNRTFVKRIRSL